MMEQEPQWMAIARREIGVKEKPGTLHHPRILEYQDHTKMIEGADEVPWCSAFVCWVMDTAGFQSTKSSAARSWAKWGKELAEPQYGCVVVLQRASADNPHAAHVGLYFGESPDDGSIMVLGGNQANQVCIKHYAKEQVIAYQ